MFRIDLNSDLGESFGAYRMEGDEEIIKYVTSVNVACGWHAGDPMVMDRTVKLAGKYGICIGAHPGYPDLMGFGRRKMVLTPLEIKNYVKYQIGALNAFVRSEGLMLQHVAPHGALGNACQYDREVSRAVCEAVYEVDRELMIFYCAGAVLGEEAERIGLNCASEIFADRAYEEDLSLVSRSRPEAMITDEDEAVSRSIRMIKEGKVLTIGGKDADIKGDTLCVHGDGPKAIEFVKKICLAFTEEGIELKNIKR